MVSRLSRGRVLVGSLGLPEGGLVQTGVSFDRLGKVSRVALGVADTAGGLLSWANPEAVSILVLGIRLNITTKTTSACTASFGTTATSGTTLSANLIDGLDINAAAGLFSNYKNPGTLGKADQVLASGKWVTGSTASGAAAGLVGFAYIQYIDI